MKPNQPSDTIYLTWDEIEETYLWSEDRIEDDDIEYVRGKVK